MDTYDIIEKIEDHQNENTEILSYETYQALDTIKSKLEVIAKFILTNGVEL